MNINYIHPAGEPCFICGDEHRSWVCPRVSEFHFSPDGEVSRIVLREYPVFRMTPELIRFDATSGEFVRSSSEND